ncbi:MAG TPA: hypothetical protein VLW05_08870 [Gaiellaceae bacterium]|nr:hypothetical protein [Gaiellaceae bacterium]
MDGPILPEHDQDENVRYTRLGMRLRIVAAVIAVVAAAIGLRTQLHDRHLAVQIEDAEPPAHVHVNIPPIFGDPTPAALLPAARSDGQPRSVCVEEWRPLPTTGAWTCSSWLPLNATQVGRRATDVGGPCTHRLVSADGSWNCWTRIAIPSLALHMPYSTPLMFGHVIPGEDGHPQVCREQARTSERHGAWKCVGAQAPPSGWRIAEPVDPGGPCSYRIADERTGVWSCQSATTQDAGTP